MDVFESLKKLLSNTNQKSVPEGICPNCWGKQEYAGQFYEAIKNENVNVNNVNEKKGWIQDYADKHLSSIQLKKHDQHLVCEKCKLTYRPS